MGDCSAVGIGILMTVVLVTILFTVHEARRNRVLSRNAIVTARIVAQHDILGTHNQRNRSVFMEMLEESYFEASEAVLGVPWRLPKKESEFGHFHTSVVVAVLV